MPLVGAVAGIGGSLISGLIGASAAKKASQAQQAAALAAANYQKGNAQQAVNFQNMMYGTQRADQMPWLNTGQNSINALNSLLGLTRFGGGTVPTRGMTSGVPLNGMMTGQASPYSGFNPLDATSGFAGNTNSVPGFDPSHIYYDAQGNLVGGPSPQPSPVGGAGPIPPTVAPPTQGFTGGPSGVMTPGPAAGVPLSGMMDGTVNPAAVAPGAVQPGGQAATNLMGPPATAGTPGLDGGPAIAPGSEANAGGVADQNFGGGPTLDSQGLPTTDANLVSDPNSYLQPFSNWSREFQAPTDVTEQNDPGYQFRLDQGTKALENSAAARGNLLSGATAKAINSYGQDYASNEYGNVYNRALGQYQQDYNIFQNQQNTQFQRLMALSNSGQTSAGQLGAEGTAASNNMANILLGSGNQVGQSLENRGAAAASGYVGAGNAYGGIASGIGNTISMYGMLNGANPYGGGGNGGYGPMYPGSDSWMLAPRNG